MSVVSEAISMHLGLTMSPHGIDGFREKMRLLDFMGDASVVYECQDLPDMADMFFRCFG